jgi:hypothetical protein
VDEPRDTQPPPGRRAPIAAATSRLSPVQEAWGRFVQHVTKECPTCRDIDVPNCGEAERLHRAWRAEDAEADQRLNGSETA